MAKYILPLTDEHVTLDLVGGKGASLARLTRADIPVPDGFCVTTTAYRQFVKENALQSQIIALLAKADISNPKTLEKVSDDIRALFAHSPISEEIADAIKAANTSLGGKDQAVAVRSSATAEDLPNLSFAGQQDTYLNIAGSHNIIQATRACWASLWTARAIGYRLRNDIDQEAISISVVVQKLVPADASGVLFTANPVNGQLGEAVITAAWGLGEAIVGGLVTPDTITVDKQSGEILSYEIADKEIMTVRVVGGTEEHPVPDEKRREAVLNKNDISRLIEFGNQIEKQYQQSMDIEWVLANDEIAIVQARPITTLKETIPSAPTEWVLPDPKGQYMRTSIIDLMPDPLTPLFETLGLSHLNKQISQLVGRMTNSSYVLSSYSTLTINGYAYMNAALNARDWAFVIFRLLPAIYPILRSGQKYWKEVACIQYEDITHQWENKQHSQLSSGELLTGVHEITDAAMDHLTSVMVFLGQCAGSESLTTNIYNRMIKREGDPLANVLFMGYDSAPVRSEKALYDLARWCQLHPDLAEYLKNTVSEKIARKIKDDNAPSGVSESVWQDWQVRFRNFLSEYGHSIYDLDFGEPLPADDPSPFLENCKLFIKGEGRNPHERQQTSAEKREALVEQCISRLKGLKLKIFRMALNWGQGLAPLREDGIANMGYGYPVLRHMLFEIGHRLVARNSLDEADDIFWLEENELELAAQALDTNQPIPDYTFQVQERKTLWRSRKSVTPPPQLPAREKYMGVKTDLFLAHGEQVGNTITGVPSSAGQVSGPARILHGPDDFDKMQKGDVLVAPITTPAWTPLFLLAAAVVTDIGGPLSHGSIVAREYGIPAVLGTGVATRVITDGQMIRVNGTTGEVILLENETVSV